MVHHRYSINKIGIGGVKLTFFDESDLSLYFDKLANEYKERILEADNKRNETKIVIEEIKKLC